LILMGIVKDALKKTIKVMGKDMGKSFKIMAKERKRAVKQADRDVKKLTKEAFAHSWVKKTKPSRYIPQGIRLKVALRDKYKCQICGAGLKRNPGRAEFDHKTKPFAKGGKATVRNLQLLCRTCNRKKGAKTNYKPDRKRRPVKRKRRRKQKGLLTRLSEWEV